jgi:hypothetical protein
MVDGLDSSVDNFAMKKSLLFALCLVGGFCGAVQAQVQVAPLRIEETRVIAFGDDKVSRQPASLKLTLSVSGPEAESAIRYGNLKLAEAVDDKGTSLIPAKDPFNDATKFKDYSNAFFRKSKFFGNNQPPVPEVELDLALPSRAAMKIVHLQGSLELADAGMLQTVEVAGLKGAVKKTLAMPAGAPVGVSVTASGDDVRSISVDISGDESALESVEVVDASGQKVSSGMSSWSFNGGPVQKTLELKRPLDDSMKLVARVSMGRKVTKVPFDLKDIALP